MTGNSLNASNFGFNDSVYFKEFEGILSKITTCFTLLKEDKTEVPLNDENGIRDIFLYKYLKNQTVKQDIGLTNFLFDKEVVEITSTGRVDIRVMPVNPFRSDDAYYIIECKRLDSKACRGSSGLNYKYIDNGIRRFIQGTYSSIYKTNAMIGFVVEKIDIKKNIDDLNYLLTNSFGDIETLTQIGKENFISDFEYHYSSKHIKTNGENLKLYHLMYHFIS